MRIACLACVSCGLACTGRNFSSTRRGRAQLARHWRHMGHCHESPRRLGTAGDTNTSRDLERTLAKVGSPNNANGPLLATCIRKHCVDIAVHFHELRAILAPGARSPHRLSAASCYRSKKSRCLRRVSAFCNGCHISATSSRTVLVFWRLKPIRSGTRKCGL